MTEIPAPLGYCSDCMAADPTNLQPAWTTFQGTAVCRTHNNDRAQIETRAATMAGEQAQGLGMSSIG